MSKLRLLLNIFHSDGGTEISFWYWKDECFILNISDQKKKLLRCNRLQFIGFCGRMMWVWWEIWETLDWVEAATLSSGIFISGTFSLGDPYLTHTHTHTHKLSRISTHRSTHAHKQSLFFVWHTHPHTHRGLSPTAFLNTMALLRWQLNWKRA